MTNLIPWRRKTHDEPAVRYPLAGLRHELDTLFERFMRGAWDLTDLGAMPRMDLEETDKALRIKLEIPGVDPADVEISVTGNLLTVRGESREEKEERGATFHRQERRAGVFERSVSLPSTVNPDKADAQFRNGLLTITLEKHPGAQAKRIKVRTE